MLHGTQLNEKKTGHMTYFVYRAHVLISSIKLSFMETKMRYDIIVIRWHRGDMPYFTF